MSSRSDFSSREVNVDETTDPMLSVIIDALSGKSRIDPYTLLQERLDAQAGDNPQAAQILQLLKQRRQEQNSESLEDEVELPSEGETYSEYDTLAENVPRGGTEAQNQEMEDTVNSVYAELETLRTRNNALAAALGACYICFGDDPFCKKCGGRGVPGSLPPKPAAFRKYVLPAFRRAKAIKIERKERSP